MKECLAQNEESQFSRMFKTAQAIDKLKNLLHAPKGNGADYESAEQLNRV